MPPRIARFMNIRKYETNSLRADKEVEWPFSEKRDNPSVFSVPFLIAGVKGSVDKRDDDEKEEEGREDSEDF